MLPAKEVFPPCSGSGPVMAVTTPPAGTLENRLDLRAYLALNNWLRWKHRRSWNIDCFIAMFKLSRGNRGVLELSDICPTAARLAGGAKCCPPQGGSLLWQQGFHCIPGKLISYLNFKWAYIFRLLKTSSCVCAVCCVWRVVCLASYTTGIHIYVQVLCILTVPRIISRTPILHWFPSIHDHHYTHNQHTLYF